jgi:hypothetical protein
VHLTVSQAIAFAGPHGDDRVAFWSLEDAVIFVVADGAGGLTGGAAAAEMLVDLVREAVSAPARPFGSSEAWVEVLRRADALLEQDARAGETTAVIVEVADDRVTGASVGDSGARVVHADRIEDLTRGQQRKPRLGSGRARPVPFSGPGLEGTLLISTDGLFDYAKPEAIAAAARSADLDEAGRALVQLVRLSSGGLQDDVAIVLGRRGLRPAGEGR